MLFKPHAHSHTILALKCFKDWLPEYTHFIGKATVVATHPRLSSLLAEATRKGY